MQRVEINQAIQKTKSPQRVVVAFVQSAPDKFNPITLEWFMRTSIDPPMFAVSIGHTRFSHQCLINHRLINICFPAPHQVDFVRLAGSKSGFDTDKMLPVQGNWFKGRFAGLPILKDAAANFECEVIAQISSGDHTIFTCRVKYAWLGEHELITLKDLSAR